MYSGQFAFLVAGNMPTSPAPTGTLQIFALVIKDIEGRTLDARFDIPAKTPMTEHVFVREWRENHARTRLPIR